VLRLPRLSERDPKDRLEVLKFCFLRVLGSARTPFGHGRRSASRVLGGATRPALALARAPRAVAVGSQRLLRPDPGSLLTAPLSI
jgi:hypothetical protein